MYAVRVGYTVRLIFEAAGSFNYVNSRFAHIVSRANSCNTPVILQAHINEDHIHCFTMLTHIMNYQKGELT